MVPSSQPPTKKTEGKRRVSVARLPFAWYALATSRELGSRPLARALYGAPLCLFRGPDGAPAALLDRCAHRNVPLSLGRVRDGQIECGYHGWRFDAAGRCARVPSLCGEPPARVLVPRFSTREQDGLVWVYGAPDVEPTHEPLSLPQDGDYATFIRVVRAEATLHATIENALDVPHTAFLHRGLFRGAGKANRIAAVMTRAGDRVQTEYVGEPRPAGIAGRILSPSGGVVTHFDRFILPSIAQVEYRLGDENHIVVTACCTPADDFVTLMYAVIRFRTRFPSSLVKLALEPVARSIFAQDARILKHQTAAVRTFGGERYASTEIDLMGPQIWRLMRRAELGKTQPGNSAPERWRRQVQLEV